MPDIFVDQEPNEKKETPPEQKSAQEMHSASHPLSDAALSISKLLHSEKHSMGLLSAYCIRPSGIKFANQEPDEEIILFLRRHFITNLPWIATTFLLFLIPPLLFIGAQLLNVFPFSPPPGLVIVIAGFYYLLILSYAFSKFISWFYNIGVVTQKRLVDINTSNILAHNTAAANFNELVDIKFTQRGFFQSFFDYGDINIQTEAIRANFEFLAAPKPTQVSDIISDLRVATKGEIDGDS